MQHVALIEQWSRSGGPGGPGRLHGLDARTKLALLLVFLVAVATTPSGAIRTLGSFAALLAFALVVSRLPARALLSRAAVVLPFSVIFALMVWWSGDGARAISLILKSYLSGLAVLLLVAATPFHEWVAALESWRMPRLLLLVMQFLYRYLFVIPAQAHRMQMAAECRRGLAPGKGLARILPAFFTMPGSGVTAAAGQIGVLFARSWQRADAVYGCMLARGFDGSFPRSRSASSFPARDVVLVIVMISILIGLRSLA